MLTAIVLVLTASLVSGQTKYCCVPDQWEGYIGLMEGLSTPGHPTFIKGGVGIAFDYTNARLAELVNVTAGSTQVRQKIIFDYKKHVMYTIMEAEKRCVRSTPPPLLRCIPDTARESGTFFFGMGNDTLKSRAFELDVPAMQLTSVFSVTQEDCVPVTEAVYGSRKGVPFIMTMGYVNIKKGIKDPSIFKVPSYCSPTRALKMELNEMKTDILFLDYIHARLGFFQ